MVLEARMQRAAKLGRHGKLRVFLVRLSRR
jgi:hypothetical protein